MAERHDVRSDASCVVQLDQMFRLAAPAIVRRPTRVAGHDGADVEPETVGEGVEDTSSRDTIPCEQLRKANTSEINGPEKHMRTAIVEVHGERRRVRVTAACPTA